jgi:hypothetical protein
MTPKLRSEKAAPMNYGITTGRRDPDFRMVRCAVLAGENICPAMLRREPGP